jgi:hypothetical protein
MSLPANKRELTLDKATPNTTEGSTVSLDNTRSTCDVWREQSRPYATCRFLFLYTRGGQLFWLGRPLCGSGPQRRSSFSQTIWISLCPHLFARQPIARESNYCRGHLPSECRFKLPVYLLSRRNDTFQRGEVIWGATTSQGPRGGGITAGANTNVGTPWVVHELFFLNTNRKSRLLSAGKNTTIMVLQSGGDLQALPDVLQGKSRPLV